MGITVGQGAESTVVALEGVIDIASAAELKAALLEVLRAGKPIRVTLDANTNLDVTAVQLLWAAERSLRGSDIEFALDGPLSEAIADAFRDAGFEPGLFVQ